jgi:hypothetical protein
MSATYEEKVIAKEILFKLIDNHYIDYDEFPETKGLVNLTLAAYEKILDTVSK